MNLKNLTSFLVTYVKRYPYRGVHRKKWFDTEYHKQGATHHGEWYDQPTGPWNIIEPVGAAPVDDRPTVIYHYAG